MLRMLPLRELQREPIREAWRDGDGVAEKAAANSDNDSPPGVGKSEIDSSDMVSESSRRSSRRDIVPSDERPFCAITTYPNLRSFRREAAWCVGRACC